MFGYNKINIIFISFFLALSILAMDYKEKPINSDKLNLPGINFLRLVFNDKILKSALIAALLVDDDNHFLRIQKLADSWNERLIELKILPPSSITLAEFERDRFAFKYVIQDEYIIKKWVPSILNTFEHNMVKMELVVPVECAGSLLKSVNVVDIFLIDHKVDLSGIGDLINIIFDDEELKANLMQLSMSTIDDIMTNEISRVLKQVDPRSMTIKKKRSNSEKVFLQNLDKKLRANNRLTELQKLEFYDADNTLARALRIIDHTEQHKAAEAVYKKLLASEKKPPVQKEKKKNNKNNKTHKTVKAVVVPIKAEELEQKPKKINVKNQQKAKEQQAKKNIRKQQNKKAKLAMTDVLKELLERARVTEEKARLAKEQEELLEQSRLDDHKSRYADILQELLEQAKDKEQYLLQNILATLPDYQWFIDNKAKLFGNGDEKQAKLDPVLFAGLFYDLQKSLSTYQAYGIASVQDDLDLLSSYTGKNWYMYEMRKQIKYIIDQRFVFKDSSLDNSYPLLQDRYNNVAKIKNKFIDTYLFLAKTALGDGYLSQIKSMELGASVLGMDENSYKLFVYELHQAIFSIVYNLNLRAPNEYSSTYFIGSSATFFSLHHNKGSIVDEVFDRNLLLYGTETYLDMLKNISFFDSSHGKSDIDVKVISPGLLEFFDGYLDVNNNKLNSEFLRINNNPVVHRLKGYLEIEDGNIYTYFFQKKLEPLRDFIAAWEKKLDRKIEINLAKGKEPLRRQSQFGEKIYTDGGGQRSLAEIMQQVSGPFVNTKRY